MFLCGELKHIEKKIVHEARRRAERCAVAAGQVKVEAQGEEKLEDLLDLRAVQRLSIGSHGHWNKTIGRVRGSLV